MFKVRSHHKKDADSASTPASTVWTNSPLSLSPGRRLSRLFLNNSKRREATSPNPLTLGGSDIPGSLAGQVLGPERPGTALGRSRGVSSTERFPRLFTSTEHKTIETVFGRDLTHLPCTCGMCRTGKLLVEFFFRHTEFSGHGGPFFRGELNISRLTRTAVPTLSAFETKALVIPEIAVFVLLFFLCAHSDKCVRHSHPKPSFQAPPDHAFSSLSASIPRIEEHT